MLWTSRELLNIKNAQLYITTFRIPKRTGKCSKIKMKDRIQPIILNHIAFGHFYRNHSIKSFES
jgi:hypothetical protein